jgi:GTPase
MVSVASGQDRDDWTPEASLDELAQLVATAGGEVVGRTSQKLNAPSKNYYIGTGKLERIAGLRESLGYDTVVTDDELSPLQQHNLEERLKVKVIDRVALILDIFARRAKTREGRLQVELAQQVYRLPRLAGQWSHLERLGGGIGTRGPGESQLETDRRLVREKIHRLEMQTEEIRKQRSLYRERRKKNAIPIVAIVGYTNAGKSTLFNALSSSEVLVEDKVFATLDPTTRRIRLADRTVLLTDTVGFIRKLPTALVTAFRATLEELTEANVLLHVVDVSSTNSVRQTSVVDDTLKELGLADKPKITVLNKVDLLLPSADNITGTAVAELLPSPDAAENAGKNTVLVSATKKWGFEQLRSAIIDLLMQDKSS